MYLLTYLGKFIHTYCRAVVSGGAEGALASPEFRSSVNPISTRGADYVRYITVSTLRFENLSKFLNHANKEGFCLTPLSGVRCGSSVKEISKLFKLAL